MALIIANMNKVTVALIIANMNKVTVALVIANMSKVTVALVIANMKMYSNLNYVPVKPLLYYENNYEFST